MGTVRYTRELLEEAARMTGNATDAVLWCGGTPTPGSRRYLRKKMAEAGLDISHFADTWVRHTEETLRKLVACSTSIAEVVRRLGISPVGGNHAHIGRRIAALRIDTSHFAPVPPRERKAMGAPGDRLTLRTPSDGRVPGDRLRKELAHRGVEDQCAECGNTGEWLGQPLRLEWTTSTATGGTTAPTICASSAPTVMRPPIPIGAVSAGGRRERQIPTRHPRTDGS